ncbi:MAG: hypothetical protein MHPSP_003728, partial [Paramarteilia canceri]
MEKSLVLLKPETLQRGLAGTILTRYEQKGLNIIAMKLVQPSRALKEKHYEEHISKPTIQ